MAVPLNKRSLIDASLTRQVTFAALDDESISASVDLGPNRYPTLERVQIKLTTTASATAAEGQTVSINIQHSDQPNIDFQIIQEVDPIFLTATESGIAATERYLALSPSIRRYVRMHTYTDDVEGGDASDAGATMEFVF